MVRGWGARATEIGAVDAGNGRRAKGIIDMGAGGGAVTGTWQCGRIGKAEGASGCRVEKKRETACVVSGGGCRRGVDRRTSKGARR